MKVLDTHVASQREHILAYLTMHSMAVDDDQLAAALGVRRQAINVVCRSLAQHGAIVRTYDEKRHKLVNRLPAPGEIVEPITSPTVAEPVIAGVDSTEVLVTPDAMAAFAYPGESGVSEDSVKAAIKYLLEHDGWTTHVQFGKLHGIDIDATRGSEHLILEAKGEGSRDAMRVNYFLGALGELLQRMDSPAAYYGIALPAHRQFIGLITHLPDWICQHLGLRFYLVRPGVHGGFEIGIIPPQASQTHG